MTQKWLQLASSAAALAMVSPSPPAHAADVDLACVAAGRQSSYSVGQLPDSQAKPVLIPLELSLEKRGAREAELKTFRLIGEQVNALPADYAMMRLSKKAGRPLWVVTADGAPAASVSLNLDDSDLATAFDRIAAAAGMRWKYDGQSVYLLNRREWTILLPVDRDLALAVQQALRDHGSDAVVDQGVIRFPGDEAKAEDVSAVVAKVYRQVRLNPFDVTWYKVFPSRGLIDWAGLAERTESVRDIGFAGKGASVVFEGEADALVEAFLSREGTVKFLGTVTMISPSPSDAVSRVVGCGQMIEPDRGLQLTGLGGKDGTVEVRYQMTGAANDMAGSTVMSLDQTLVVASATPKEGGYFVAVVRPRVLEVAGDPLGTAP